MAVQAKNKNSLLDKIKKDIASAGQARKGVWFIKSDQKKRVRFFTDFEAAMEIEWHSKWEGNRAEVDIPCLKLWSKDCPFCGQTEIRTRTKYIWQVWDYDSKERKLFAFYANRNSPVPAMVANYESFDTILTQDFSVIKAGEGTNSTFTLVPLGLSKFRVDDPKAKAVAEDRLLKMIWAGFGTGELDDYPNSDEEESEEDEDSDEEESEDESEYDDEEEESEEEEPEPPPKKRKIAAVPAQKVRRR